MKIFLPTVVVGSLAAASVNSKYAAPQPAQPKPYFKPQYPYPQEPYNPYGHTQDYIRPVAPKAAKPYPYIKLPKKNERESLNLPDFGPGHCFLQGAPWTECGRKSLTSYFLDQCMSLYTRMSVNVDGICGSDPKRALKQQGTKYNYNLEAYEPKQYPNSPYYTQPAKASTPTKYGKNSAPATNKEKEMPAKVDEYASAYGSEYLKERCYQHTYISITTATVMCLTENIIRIKFIEHYAADAAKNPIEGPQLYLKKLHSFMDEVISCNKGGQHNFPNLYLTFKDIDAVKYNPNAPFYVNDDNDVSLYHHSSAEASGMAAYTLGEEFRCANVDRKYGDVYRYVPSDGHYSGYKAASPTYIKYSKAAKAITSDGMKRVCSDSSGIHTTDMSLRSLYDAVHFHTDKNSALRRPLTLAEMAVSGAGILEQPLLEGFGIMYFCAFYACKANNGGDVDGNCFPEFNPENEWDLNASSEKYQAIKQASDKVNTCMKKKFISAHDLALNRYVSNFNHNLNERSYVCRNEQEIVSFLEKMYGSTWADNENDAMRWVYGRALADQKMQSLNDCSSNKKLYDELLDALNNVGKECDKNKAEYKKDKSAFELKKYQYQQQQQYYYGQQQNQYKQPVSRGYGSN